MTIRLHNLINHKANLSDPYWLRTLGHNSFQTCWKLSDSKPFNNFYVIHVHQLISNYDYKYNFVKIEKSKMSEFSNFKK